MLSAEGFIFAAVALAVTLAVPNPQRQPRFKKLKPEGLMLGAVGVLVALAVGGVSAWVGLCKSHAFCGLQGVLVGGALMIGIVGMPVIALLVVLSAAKKTKPKKLV